MFTSILEWSNYFTIRSYFVIPVPRRKGEDSKLVQGTSYKWAGAEMSASAVEHTTHRFCLCGLLELSGPVVSFATPTFTLTGSSVEEMFLPMVLEVAVSCSFPLRMRVYALLVEAIVTHMLCGEERWWTDHPRLKQPPGVPATAWLAILSSW